MLKDLFRMHEGNGVTVFVRDRVDGSVDVFHGQLVLVDTDHLEDGVDQFGAALHYTGSNAIPIFHDGKFDDDVVQVVFQTQLENQPDDTIIIGALGTVHLAVHLFTGGQA